MAISSRWTPLVHTLIPSSRRLQSRLPLSLWLCTPNERVKRAVVALPLPANETAARETAVTSVSSHFDCITLQQSSFLHTRLLSRINMMLYFDGSRNLFSSRYFAVVQRIDVGWRWQQMDGRETSAICSAHFVVNAQTRVHSSYMGRQTKRERRRPRHADECGRRRSSLQLSGSDHDCRAF